MLPLLIPGLYLQWCYIYEYLKFNTTWSDTVVRKIWTVNLNMRLQIRLGYVSEHFQQDFFFIMDIFGLRIFQVRVEFGNVRKRNFKPLNFNFLNIDFSKNSHDTYFVDLLNLNNFDRSEIFWEINISGVIRGGHFWREGWWSGYIVLYHRP